MARRHAHPAHRPRQVLRLHGPATPAPAAGESMNAWLRQHRYALMAPADQQPFSSLANLLVMAWPWRCRCWAAPSVSVQPVARQMSVTPEVTVFMRVDAPAGAAAGVAKRIQSENHDDVRRARGRRDDALASLRANPWQQALAVLPGNPLPDAVVTLADGEDLSGRATGWPRYGSGTRSTWCSWTAPGSSGWRPSCASPASAWASWPPAWWWATVFNTVRMQALSQREEIAWRWSAPPNPSCAVPSCT